MITILSLPTGNATNVQRACSRLGIASRISNDPKVIELSDGLILPGVGAAGPTITYLQATKLDQIICSYSKPFLGICLGMQLLFDFSEEGQSACLGIIPGTVRLLPSSVTSPHMGWNMIRSDDGPREYVFFVHSYVCVPEDPSIITMTTLYGSNICAGVRQGNFSGVQWHPEKSGATGDAYLLSFAEQC